MYVSSARRTTSEIVSERRTATSLDSFHRLSLMRIARGVVPLDIGANRCSQGIEAGVDAVDIFNAHRGDVALGVIDEGDVIVALNLGDDLHHVERCNRVGLGEALNDRENWREAHGVFLCLVLRLICKTLQGVYTPCQLLKEGGEHNRLVQSG